MPLTLLGFHGKPHDIGVSKTCAAPGECVFLLDFARPFERIRWFGIRNAVLGPTVAFLIPIVHASEKSGGYVFGISRGDLYFGDIPKLWREHRAAPRAPASDVVDGLQVVADFARHFPEECA